MRRLSTLLPLEPRTDRRAERRWDALALLLFLLATLWLHRTMLGADWTRDAPVGLLPGAAATGDRYPGSALVQTDHQFVIWLIARNARAVLTQPFSLHAAEPCFPVERSLALGEPALSLAWLGAPLWLVTGDPIATYVGVLLLLPVFSALAMYWLVKRWTGLPGAGLVAGLLYGFHSLKVQDPVHIYVFDTLGTVLALYFAERFFARRRWRDVFALAAAIALQLGGSLYSVVAAVLTGLPFVVFGLRREGFTAQRPAQWAALAGLVGLAALLLYGPILSLSSAGALSGRPLQIFRPLSIYLPDQVGFPGWPTLALLVAAFALPARRSLAGIAGDPRAALAVAIAAIHVVSIGAVSGDFTVPVVWDGEGWPPNLYMALGTLLPGLDLVRAPAAIFNCAVLAIAILVGIGTAGLLRRLAGARAGWLLVVLLAAVFVDMLRPPALGLDADYTYARWRMRPPDERIAFFERLDALGNDGPLLMVPATPRRPRRESEATLLAAYHQRRIGQCYNSQHTPEVDRVRETSEALPAPHAIRALGEMGFTTFVVSHGPGDVRGPARRKAWLALTLGERAPLVRVHGDEAWTAFAIAPPASGS